MNSMWTAETRPVPNCMTGFRPSRKSFWPGRSVRMQSSLNRKHHWGVILSGGDGIRLRALTRLLSGDDRPKQFCRLAGEETLLGQTRRRVAKILPEDRTLHVLAKAHEPFYAAELDRVPPRELVQGEPSVLILRVSHGSLSDGVVLLPPR